MIFVTGGTGLVGSHLLLELARNGAKVRALRRKKSNLELVKKVFGWYSNDSESLFNKIEWVEGEMLDIYSLENALKGIELIYNCAAVVSFDSRKRRELISTNVNGSANLVNAAISCGVKRICHVSSVSALGKTLDGMPVTEETKWTPSRKNSGYSESKFFSEAEIWRGVEEGLEAVVVNPSVIIGPGGWDSGSTGFFPVIYKGLRFYTKGKTGFVDVRDVVDAMLLLTRNDNFVLARNRKFIISAENIGYYELFTKIADALQKPRPSIYASALILAVAWRAAAVWSLITGKSARITRETVASSNRETQFDGSAITQLSGFTYRPVDDAIAHTADCFLKDNDPLAR